jgi:segregation and condensation protein B
LIEETGHDHETGAHLYRTTTYFLERLGLKSLDELPPIAAHLPMPDNVEEVLDLANN